MEECTTYDKKSLKKVLGKTADFPELSRDCVAFANAKGGFLHIGVEDGDELPPANQKIEYGLEEKIVRRINELTINVALQAEIVEAENGGQYINLKVFPSKVAVASTTKGQFFYRDGDSCRPLLPDELSRLMNDKPAYSWETKVSLSIPWQNADNLKLQKFVHDIRQSDRVSVFVKEKNEEEMLAYYQMIDDNGKLTNLGVLWIGKPEQRARLLYSPIIQYIKYDSEENKVLKYVWDDYRFNPQELLEDIWQTVPDWKESNEISDGLWRKNIPAYDEKVVRELLCNALVHRPYTTRGDIFIKLYPDRMEVTNPGLLPLGVTTSNILQKTVKRNPHLTKVFYDLHLMEAEGSGYDLIYEMQLSAGKQVPVVVEGDDYVEVTVSRRIISKEISRIYDYLAYNFKVSQKGIIALGIILQKGNVSAMELSKELQLGDSDRLRSYTMPLMENNIVLTTGKGKGTQYKVNPKFVSEAKIQSKTSLKTLEPYALKALVKEDLRFHPESSIAEIGSRLPDVNRKDLEEMVRKMASAGEITTIGGRKYRKYALNQ
ncbi:MAG: putative DNA binding domain-containing protein [Bacteroidales bacterium]|nr:putative DNA binding domain-containing protein [Bacteroidales bacterium]